MANIFEKLRDDFLKYTKPANSGPTVSETVHSLRKEVARLKTSLEHKDFDLITQLSGKFGVSSGSNKKKYLEAYVSWVYANISVIAEKVADINFELFRLGKNKGKESLDLVTEHPAMDLLLKVNDFQTKWDLVFIWTFHMLSIGEAAWYLVGRKNPNAEPTEIWPLRPDYLEIIPGNLEKNEFVERYEYKVPGKKTVIFAPWEILFFKMPHATNAYRGYGTVEAAATDIDIDQFAMNFNRNFYLNYARPDAVLTTENKLSEETYDRLQKSWQAKYGGTDNAGKTAILEQGLDYKSIQPTQNDMQFLEQQRWNRDKLMALFRNTKIALGIVEDVNRANAEASELVWIKHTIKPKMQRLVDYLNEFFVPIYGDDLLLGFEDPLPETVELKLVEYEKGIDKWLTRNEIREREGLDPVDGGDALYIPITSIPLGPAEVRPESMDNQQQFMILPVKKGESKHLLRRYSLEIKKLRNRQDRFKRMQNQIDKVLSKMMESYQTSKKLEDGPISKDMQEKRWNQFVKLANVFESKIEKMIEAVIQRHKEKTVELIGNKYKPRKAYFRKKDVNDLLPDDESFVRVSIDALRPIFLAIAAEQGKDVFDFLGIHAEFIATEELIKIFDKIALTASESYVGTTRDRIRSALLEGIKEGEGIEPLQRRIRDAYDGLSIPEARRVARTESIRVANATNEDAYRQSNVVHAKQWFTALDERVDDECAALDGKIVDIDEDFTEVDGVPREYANVGFPPLHPNCRCVISPVILGKATQSGYMKKRIKQQVEKDSGQKITNKIEEELAAKLDELIKAVDYE